MSAGRYMAAQRTLTAANCSAIVTTTKLLQDLKNQVMTTNVWVDQVINLFFTEIAVKLFAAPLSAVWVASDHQT